MALAPPPKPEPTLPEGLDRITLLGTGLDKVTRNQDEMPNTLNEVTCAGLPKPKATLWTPAQGSISVGGAPIEVLRRYIQGQARSP